MDDKKCMADVSEVTEDHKEIDPKTGMQKGYVVICADDRQKGFIRPYRTEYIHVGIKPRYPLRDLTDEEKERHAKWNYVKFEKYPELLGRFWTQEQLDKTGCGGLTVIAREIAETYARNPKFYGGTYCASCHSHHPLAEFVWAGTDIIVGS